MNGFNQKLQQLKEDDLQYQAFLSNGNTLVKAGPGSGKTTILTMKIADLLKKNIVEPRGLACITFTKDAAKEFGKRVRNLGVKPRKNVFLGTLHSLCIAQIILPFKLTATKHISVDILRDKELEMIFKNIKDKMLSMYAENLLPDNIDKLDKYRSSNFEGFSKIIEIDRNEVWELFTVEFENELIKQGKTDYVMLVKKSIEVIRQSSLVRSVIEAKFKWLLVDEYQDFNKLLHEFVLTIKEYTDIKLYIVGDPNQSIYSFMGSSYEYFHEFYEDSSFKIINLKNNYRSTQKIVDAASQFLNIDDVEYKAMDQKNLTTNFEFITCKVGWKDQVKYIIDYIIPSCDQNKISRSEICILVNNNYKAKNVQAELQKSNIKGKINKDELNNNIFIQFLLNYIKHVTSKDVPFKLLFESWMKIKFKEKKTFSDKLINQERIELYKIIEESNQFLTDFNKWINKSIKLLKIKSLLNEYIDTDSFIELTTIYEYFQENMIITVAQKKEKLFSSDEIIISTRHSSKGLEFDVVILLEMNEGAFPKSDKDLEFKDYLEEERIFFVCITRARKDVYLLSSSSAWIMGENGWEQRTQNPSFFIEELLRICNDLSVGYKKIDMNII